MRPYSTKKTPKNLALFWVVLSENRVTHPCNFGLCRVWYLLMSASLAGARDAENNPWLIWTSGVNVCPFIVDLPPPRRPPPPPRPPLSLLPPTATDSLNISPGVTKNHIVQNGVQKSHAHNKEIPQRSPSRKQQHSQRTSNTSSHRPVLSNWRVKFIFSWLSNSLHRYVNRRPICADLAKLWVRNVS